MSFPSLRPDKLASMDLAPLYYLSNFRSLLDWVSCRYSDLLSAEEQHFIRAFAALPANAQALLVRVIMRPRPLLRVSTLHYAEIAHGSEALATLLANGWLSADPELSLDTLFSLATKAELLADADAFAPHTLNPRQRKAELREQLEPLSHELRGWAQWLPHNDDQLISLNDRALIERLRLLFFGNAYQDWSTFVVADLGHARYETVDIGDDARAFQTRIDLDTYDWLLGISARNQAGEALEDLWAELADPVADCSAVMLARQHKAQFQLGQAAERQQDWPMAKVIYEACGYRLARHRLVRVYEKLADWPAAYALAQCILAEPSSEQERQAVQRALPRLAKKCGAPAPARVNALLAAPEHTLTLPQAPSTSVEWAAREALASPEYAVYYVENTLFTGLFGLLYWPAIFAPVPGAFYHPYQSGPADLFHPEFVRRRAALIAEITSSLNSGAYRERIIQCFHAKYGIENPFVIWPVLSAELLEQALLCIPAAQLKVIFLRLLDDLKANRSGFPDLIRLSSIEAIAQGSAPTFTLIEIKGPNDSLQDNQARWMDCFCRHDLPCQLLHLRWPA